MSDSIVSTLRAMARNYAGGHSWDHLDGEAVSKAADEIERLRKACEGEFRSVEVLNEANHKLQAQLADLKRRHDDLHRDMATIAGREVPKGCTVADYAAASIAGALSASAEPSAPTWSCQSCQLEQPTARPCDACSGKTELIPVKS